MAERDEAERKILVTLRNVDEARLPERMERLARHAIPAAILLRLRAEPWRRHAPEQPNITRSARYWLKQIGEEDERRADSTGRRGRDPTTL
jgi:hypothetical protein